MVFSSHIFLFGFLPIALLMYYGGPRRWRNLVLTAVSYVFYGWATPYFIFLILWSTLVDYTCGNFISGHWQLPAAWRTVNVEGVDQRVRRFFLGASIVSNLGMLGFFKYFTFAEQNVNALLRVFGHGTMPLLLVTLPAGISFYTFESISYNVDIYYGRAKPAIAWILSRSGPKVRGPWQRGWAEVEALGAFACYITQFPHLVAGPIIRYQDLEHQIHARTHTLEKFGQGVFFLSLGLAKKVLLANPMGDLADATFGAAALGPVDAWYGLAAYAFQIYFDFSGYSDMAIGLGLFFGFEFRKNFDAPYQAQSLTEFWRRWHISLSTWLRDYLYLPLGGNRKGPVRTYVNLLTVMVLGGLWHGASWNFLIWGAIHGSWLALERANGRAPFYLATPRFVRTLVTFLIVNLAWVFFRAPTLTAAVDYLAGLAGLQNVQTAQLSIRTILYSPFSVSCFVACVGVAFFGVQSWDLARRITIPKAGLALALLAWAVVAISTQAFSPFLYFRF